MGGAMKKKKNPWGKKTKGSFIREMRPKMAASIHLWVASFISSKVIPVLNYTSDHADSIAPHMLNHCT
jgi:hypothetical protein